MLIIEIEKGKTEQPIVTASEIRPEELFRDFDRDLYIRLEDGALDLESKLCYSETELCEMGSFTRCQIVKGTVEIKVTLE